MNREEYTPYGETSFGSYARKRYRYSGKERDDETGLYYYGARYYAPWLGRWCSADPAGMVDGINLYTYVRNNPINMFDRQGLQAEPEIDLSSVGNEINPDNDPQGGEGISSELTSEDLNLPEGYTGEWSPQATATSGTLPEAKPGLGKLLGALQGVIDKAKKVPVIGKLAKGLVPYDILICG